MVVLWKISIWQKLKKHDFARAFLITTIITVASLIILIPYLMGIIFHVAIRMLMSIFLFVFHLFLIKKFYHTKWLKSVKIYLLSFLFTFLVGMVISMILFILILFFRIIF